MKIKCDSCGLKAVWAYMPNDKFHYCENHVPRGCSCMTDEDDNYLKDEQDRLLPCCEYDYDINGFEEHDD